ncbi:unnamed protein product [Coffea canephora]|uniref:DH200=94 genomic scaffold, scaffold_261 n=1 Tax=Coffea canephora TaxID=49390 RepID=A0A068VD18_COFCA|nr:unnamed protein product [Coffea canephora]
MSGRIHPSTALAEIVFWYCALFLALKLVLSCCESTEEEFEPCDEIHAVREGETLHTISGKCGDPYIFEQNPHIHDPDDVFPELVIKITPFTNM